MDTKYRYDRSCGIPKIVACTQLEKTVCLYIYKPNVIRDEHKTSSYPSSKGTQMRWSLVSIKETNLHIYLPSCTDAVTIKAVLTLLSSINNLNSCNMHREHGDDPRSEELQKELRSCIPLPTKSNYLVAYIKPKNHFRRYGSCPNALQKDCIQTRYHVL
jgi:hypothetical protein